MEEKKFELIQESFVNYFSTVMAGLYLEKLLRKWLKVIQENHREKLSTLDTAIGKSVEVFTCLAPEIDVYYISVGSHIAEFGTNLGNDIEYYVFKDNVCVDAFILPNELIAKTLTPDLAGQFTDFYKITESLNDIPTGQRADPKKILGIKDKLN